MDNHYIYIKIMACTSCSTGADGGHQKGVIIMGLAAPIAATNFRFSIGLSNMTLPGGQAPFDCVEITF